MNGERFRATVFETPLRDGAGRQTGWMSAVLDQSTQHRVEKVARQQQERLQATARLATVGEMASLLSHALNQPLSAIAAYATGSLHMMDRQLAARLDDALELGALLRQATQRIAEQAARAGRLINSVHDFMRRREHAREAPIDAVLPLVHLQARKSETRIAVDAPSLLPRGAVRPGDGRVGVAEPQPQRHPGDAGRDWHRVRPRADASRLPDACRLVADRRRRPRARRVRHGRGAAFHTLFTTRTEGMRLGPSVRRGIVEHIVRDAVAWLLRLRRLLSEGHRSAEAFETALATWRRAVRGQWPGAPSYLLLVLRMGGMRGWRSANAWSSGS